MKKLPIPNAYKCIQQRCHSAYHDCHNLKKKRTLFCIVYTFSIQASCGIGDMPSGAACGDSVHNLFRISVIQDLTRLLSNANAQMTSEEGSHWLIESPTMFHILITRPPEICVNLVFKHIHATISYFLVSNLLIWSFINVTPCPLVLLSFLREKTKYINIVITIQYHLSVLESF